MRKYKKEFKKLNHDAKTDQELFGDLYDLYYNNRDLKLLLDLLATSSGVAPCLRLLCLFDKKMREMAEVNQLNVTSVQKEGSGRLDAVIKFEDPTIIKDVFYKIADVTCTYTVEIAPPINDVSSAQWSEGVTKPLRSYS